MNYDNFEEVNSVYTWWKKVPFLLSNSFENLITIGLKNLLTITEKNEIVNWQQCAV